ncbi:hypothetical protein H5410_034301 [Solanum commersonii]|uniref:Uncharacterized protein n=1 Tax=Solanum commersonii TaxID=4109 RepID=A0A9J5YQA7_SOLCO|nr:hypothetical protein H5410_034301 [Solanum commersonii]
MEGIFPFKKDVQEQHDSDTSSQYHFSYDDLIMPSYNSVPVDFSSEDHRVLPPTNVDIEEADNGVDVVSPHAVLGAGSNTNIEVIPSTVTEQPNTADTADIRRSTRGSKPPIWHKDYVVKAVTWRYLRRRKTLIGANSEVAVSESRVCTGKVVIFFLTPKTLLHSFSTTFRLYEGWRSAYDL